MSLMDILNGARERKNSFVQSLTGSDSLYGKAVGFRDSLEQKKGDLLNQGMRDIGFGNAQQIVKPYAPVSFDNGIAQNSAKLMQQELKSAGAYNPAAGMMDLGNISLETPNLQDIYAPSQDTYETGLEREIRLNNQLDYGGGALDSSDPAADNIANPPPGILSMN